MRLKTPPTAGHGLRLRKLTRGSAAVWRVVEPGETASIHDVEVETLPADRLPALLGGLLQARCFDAVRAVLDAVDPRRWREAVEGEPPEATAAVTAFLRARVGAMEAPDGRGMAREVPAIVDELLDLPDDSLHELIILELRDEADLLEDLRSELVGRQRRFPDERGPELDALIEYACQIGQLADGEAPQRSLAWLRATYAGRWVVTSSTQEIGQSRPIGQLSLLSLLEVVRDRLAGETVAREHRRRPDPHRHPVRQLKRLGDDILGGFSALMAALIDQITMLCRAHPMDTVAAAIAIVHAIADTGDIGRPWSEAFLTEASPVLLDRLAEPPPDGADAWDHARILAAYRDLARRDDLARTVVAALVPRLNQGLASGASELLARAGGHLGGTLAGCLVAVAQLPHGTTEVLRTFALIQPLMGELLAGDDPSRVPGPGTGPALEHRWTESTCESFTLALFAYAQRFGRTEFEQLPGDVQQFILWLVERVARLVPENPGSVFPVTKLDRSQLLRISTALLQLRNPPAPVAGLLRQLARLRRAALEGYLTLEEFEIILDGYTSAVVCDAPDLLVVYEAVIARLITRMGHAPSVGAVRLSVLAYNRRDALRRQADRQGRDARRRAWSHGNTAGAKQARVKADKLRLCGKAVRDELAALLLIAVVNLRQAIAAYPPDQQRRVLCELAQLRGLGISRSSRPAFEDQDSPVLGGIDQAVAETFGQLSASRTMIGALADAPTHHLAALLYSYGWLRVQGASDARLVDELIAELEARAPCMSPLERTALLGALAPLRHPPPELAEFLDGVIAGLRA